MRFLYSFLIAISYFTIIPMPFINWENGRNKYVPLFIPFVGVIVGVIGMFVYMLLEYLPVSGVLKAVLFMAYFLMITGGIHFDGLMDTADGYFSRREIPRKLEIMTDSRVGAFAVMTAVLVLMLKFGAFVELFANDKVNPLIIVLIPIMSRSLQATMIYLFPQAKEGGMATMFPTEHPKVYLFFFGAMFGIAAHRIFRLLPINYIFVPIVAILFYIFYYFSTKKNFGGVTGDMLGAFVELSELLMWLTFILVGVN